MVPEPGVNPAGDQPVEPEAGSVPEPPSGPPQVPPNWPSGQENWPGGQPGYPSGQENWPGGQPGYPSGQQNWPGGQPGYPSGQQNWPGGQPGYPTGQPPAGFYQPQFVPEPPKPEPLPVEPKEYHQFYRAPAFRWWKPLLALVVFGLAFIVPAFVVVLAALAWELSQGVQLAELTDNLNTPVFFAANNVLLAAGIPAAMLASWLVYRQRPGFLSSITGRFRWGVFGQFLLIAGPLMVIWMVGEILLNGGLGDLSWGPDSLFLLVTIVLTTPLQAAGEEYATRGLLARSIGSWFGNRVVALAVATVVNGVIFMSLHGAGDPWLNAYYLTVAVVFTLLTWRTGGLEAAIVMHVVNNFLGELTLPFSPDDLAHLFDRQAGVAGPETLIQIAVTVFVGAMLWWRASRLGLPRATAPGAVPAQPWQPPVVA